MISWDLCNSLAGRLLIQRWIHRGGGGGEGVITPFGKARRVTDGSQTGHRRVTDGSQTGHRRVTDGSQTGHRRVTDGVMTG